MTRFNGNVLSVTVGTLKLLSVSCQKICVRTHRSQAAKGPDVIDMSRRMMVLLGYCLEKHVYSGLIFLSSKMLSRVALFKQATISSSRTTAFVSHRTTTTYSLWRPRPATWMPRCRGLAVLLMAPVAGETKSPAASLSPRSKGPPHSRSDLGRSCTR